MKILPTFVNRLEDKSILIEWVRKTWRFGVILDRWQSCWFFVSSLHQHDIGGYLVRPALIACIIIALLVCRLY